MSERTQRTLTRKPPVSIDTASPARMLLIVFDVPAELGCCRDTVYALLATGDSASVRLAGRLRRVRRADVLASVRALPSVGRHS